MKKNRIKEAFLTELRKVPIVQVACEKTGISRKSIYQWKKSDETFSKAMDEAMTDGEAFINDMSENQLLFLVKEKSWPALAFWLRHRHPKFKDKVEITAKIEKQEALSPEQEEIVREALRLASVKPLETDTNIK